MALKGMAFLLFKILRAPVCALRAGTFCFNYCLTLKLIKYPTAVTLQSQLLLQRELVIDQSKRQTKTYSSFD